MKVTRTIQPSDRLVLLMHDHLATRHGKMGFALLRYRPDQVVAVIDAAHRGAALREVAGIDHPAPVVGSFAEAASYVGDVLVIAVATTGGVLPPAFRAEIAAALRAGLSVVHPLHGRLADDPEFAPLVQPGRFIWDVRVEPDVLVNGSARAADLPCSRVLTVGTDMAIGKMTASLECDGEARRRGLRSAFLASGQIGICVSGDGVALDAVRVDFASGAVEQLVERYGVNHDVLWLEGQGSLLNPASTAWLPLIRGACPTHLVLCVRAGQTHVDRFRHIPIPPLRDVIATYEAVAALAGGVCPRVIALSVNCGGLSDEHARAAVDGLADECGLPATDVLRFGARPIVDAVVATG